MLSSATTTAMAFPSPEELRGTVQGTMVYLSIYFFVAIPFQAFSKFYLLKLKKEQLKNNNHKKTDNDDLSSSAAPPINNNTRINFRAIKYYNRDDTIALIGDRWCGQFHEYSFLFLPLLWIHALFVDCTTSFQISLIYSLSRGIFPLVYSYNVYPGVLLSAIPNYIILNYLGIRIVWFYLL